MSIEDINTVVDNALMDNSSEMREALYNAINDKVFAAIEQRKIAVAANLLAQHGQQVETGTETE